MSGLGTFIFPFFVVGCISFSMLFRIESLHLIGGVVFCLRASVAGLWFIIMKYMVLRSEAYHYVCCWLWCIFAQLFVDLLVVWLAGASKKWQVPNFCWIDRTNATRYVNFGMCRLFAVIFWFEIYACLNSSKICAWLLVVSVFEFLMVMGLCFAYTWYVMWVLLAEYSQGVI